MTTDFWQKLFQGFRPEDQKLLVVRTSDGLEVAVQHLARIEESLVMIRGRIAGTADSGRLFLLPYAQMSSVYVNRVVMSEEVDLFSPTVTPERKMEVARQVAEMERKAREETKAAELAKGVGDKPAEAALKKLEALRDELDAARGPSDVAPLPQRQGQQRALPELPRALPGRN